MGSVVSMELSCAFPPRLDVPDLVAHAELLGYERAWVYDSPALYGDVWMSLARCAGTTTRIGLGPAVLVPSLRHPMVNAAAIATLEQLAPGRVSAALGTGFTGRYVLGQRPMTWKATERYLNQLTGLLRGEVVDIDGAPCQMIHPDGYVADRPLPVPILVGANGPKGLAVAERAGAEGVISIFGAQPGWERCALFAYGTVLDDDESPASERVLAAAGPGAAVMLHGMYEADPGLLDGVEGGPVWREDLERFPPSERHLHTHREHFVGLTDRDRTAISPELIQAATWTGDARALGVRLRDAEESGISEFVYAPMGPDPRRELEAFRTLF